MRVYTRSGDKKQTGLFGGSRVKKNHIRVECYGTFDEVNSFIGLLRSKLTLEHKWQEKLYKIQGDLMDLMSHLATPYDCEKVNTRNKPTELAELCEKWIDDMHAEMGTLSEYFLLPGGNEISSLCHIVRTQLRRAERLMISLDEVEPLEEYMFPMVNRLSDLFFVMARYELHFSDIDEERWIPFRKNKR